MNCIIVDDDEITRNILEALVMNTKFLNLMGTCADGISASNTILNNKIDLVFLDIEMPGMSGIELIKSLSGKKPQVILVTANKEYAAEAFDFEVTDFLVKPVTQERFLKAVGKAKQMQESKKRFSELFIKVDSRLVKINTNEILFIEALADYVSIYTPVNKYTIHSTMKGIETKLPSDEFMRTHNSYIVRLDKISEIEDNSLIIGKKLIPLSRSNKKELMNRLKLL